MEHLLYISQLEIIEISKTILRPHFWTQITVYLKHHPQQSGAVAAEDRVLKFLIEVFVLHSN